MNEIKKVIISPDNQVRIYKLQPGDEFYISYKGIRYKSGDRHLEYPAIVRQVVYKPQPWYLFWKKKKSMDTFQLGKVNKHHLAFFKKIFYNKIKIKGEIICKNIMI